MQLSSLSKEFDINAMNLIWTVAILEAASEARRQAGGVRGSIGLKD